MENLQRELEKELNLIKSPAPSRKATEWTLLMVGEHGEIKRADKFASRLQYYRLYLFIFVLLIAGLSFIYYNAYRVNIVLTQENHDYKSAIEKLQKDRDTLTARLIVYSEANGDALNLTYDTDSADDIKMIASSSVKKVSPATGADSSGSNSYNTNNDSPVQNDLSDAELVKAPENSERGQSGSETVYTEPVVDLIKANVENLKLEPDASTNYVKVQFRVINASDVRQISGNVFGILKTENADESDWVIKPNGSIFNGYPNNVKLGYSFSISRYKTIILKYPDLKEFSLYKSIKIVVYSKNGDLIFDKDFPVDL